MRLGLAVAGLFAIALCTLLFGFGYSQDALPLDEQFTLIYQDYPQANVAYRDFYVYLAGGDRISISISVTGQPIEFDIIDSAGQFILTKDNTDSVNEEWTAPKSDTFDLYFLHRGGALTGDSQVHFSAHRAGEGQTGGGFDPLPIIVVVIVLLVVIVSVFLIVRIRHTPQLPPPEEPPPPPP